MIDLLSEVVISVGKAVSKRRNIDAIDGGWQGDQIKTVADEFADKMIQRELIKILSIPIISEENIKSHVLVRPDKYWLIDPIDGTRSLVDGFSGWVTQVALIEMGKPVLAAIYAPDLDLLYTSKLGAGAYCNNKKIIVNSEYNERKVLIDNYPEPRGIAKVIMNGIRCKDYLESGSISLKICRVADGTADIFIKDVVIRDWDVAAPMLVLQEAGGNILQFNGAKFSLSDNFEKYGIIVSNESKCMGEILDFLEKIVVE